MNSDSRLFLSLVAGIALGTGLGALIGANLLQDLSLGTGIGLLVGFGLGVIVGAWSQ